jgi:hypothetical protein
MVNHPQERVFCRDRDGCEYWRMAGWGTWIRTKIDGVRVRCSTVELSPNGRSKRAGRRAGDSGVNSEAGAPAQASHTCSTATTPGAAFNAPATAALTA